MTSSPSTPHHHTDRLLQNVVAGGYCIGCGVCAARENSSLRIVLDNDGKLQACAKKIHSGDTVNVCAICPFSGESPDETVLGGNLSSYNTEYNHYIGYYQNLYAGHVERNSERINSASGGLVTWLLVTLLQKGMIDGVVHVRPCKPTASNPLVLQYRISRTEEEIRSGAGSHYYPIEMSSVLKEIRENEGRYAVVGIPKFITAVRLLMKEEPIFKQRIAYCIGIIAGHMKSKHFADSIAWQKGIPPESVEEIRFRKKKPDRTARNSYVYIKGNSDNGVKEELIYSKNQFGRNNWGLKFFEYEAAEFSDDLMAETADISFGDAWLPRYVHNWRGTNIVIVRHHTLNTLLRKAARDKKIWLEDMNTKDMIESQRSGLRHMREGSAIRAEQKQQDGLWHPPLRMFHNNSTNPYFKNIIQERTRIATESFPAFNKAIQEKDFTVYTTIMKPLIRGYYRQRPLWYRALSWIQRHVPYL
ncbi:coenzyme F420 hydrogenase [Candidatus Peregrinibacteria bacterium CG10_big_fil_rev_8_21_14_0_10_42_8]|nr:MAG: coenzyme F420 hydrogenase [Candidatus Peregrinibacteria bacterium CG10_big_fil_rev_8_21_14_0_10_42_8]